MIIIQFQVFCYDSQNGWMLHSRYPSDEYGLAMMEVRDLERKGRAARIVRETYDSDTNACEETEEYVSRSAGRGRTSTVRNKSKAKGGRVPSKSQHTQRGVSTRKKNRTRTGAGGDKPTATVAMSRAFPLILGILLVGVVSGIVTLYALPYLIKMTIYMGGHFAPGPDSYDTLALLTFAAAFLVVVVPLTLIFLPNMFRIEAPVATNVQSYDQHMENSLENLSRQALQEEQVKNQQAALLPVVEIPPETVPQQSAEERPAPVPEPPVPKEELESASPATIEAEPKLRMFVDSAVQAIKITKTKLDNYNKFALDLYIVGAIDMLAKQRKLVVQDCRQLTAYALGNLGTKPEMANQFYDKVSDYLVEERYKKMVTYGGAAMDDYLKGDEGSAHAQLTCAIQDWSRGPVGQTGPTVTVMFTDMGEATDLIQDQGDMAIQDIVRRHNTIVRMAISQYGGKEIKHTGDGIMATFDDCTKAVDATVSIQRNVDNHNKARPDQPLLVRIGLNAGNPIQEENDIFGVTVQLASRVCAATQYGRIMCTESVATRCRGNNEFITPMGAYDLKGFKDPVPLYLIMW